MSVDGDLRRLPGESILLEELYKYGLEPARDRAVAYAGNGILMAWHHLPVAPWQTEAWIEERRRTLSPNQFLRLIENKFVTSENVFRAPASVGPHRKSEYRLHATEQTAPVFIGIDAGIKHDSTAHRYGSRRYR